MNKLIVMGNLTRDPQKGASETVVVAKFGIALNEYTGGEKETLFLDVVAFGKTAEYALNYLGKGDRVVLVGRLDLRSYVDRSGNKRTAVGMVATEIYRVKSAEPAAHEPGPDPDDDRYDPFRPDPSDARAEDDEDDGYENPFRDD